MLFVRIHLFIGIIIGDLELHLIDETCGIQYFPQDKDRLSADIGQEADSRESKEYGQARGAYEVLDKLTHEETMIATRAVAGIDEERRKKLGEGDRAPDHQNHERQEPLQEIHPVGTNEMDAEENEEKWYHKGGDAEAALDEIPRDVGTKTAAGVAELVFLIHDFTFTWIFYQTLVCCACGEIGDECHNEIDGNTHQQ